MTHIGESKRVTFTLDTVEIAEISTNNMVPLGFDDYQARMYKFSHLLPYSIGNALLNHSNETIKLWHERFIHLKYRYSNH